MLHLNHLLEAGGVDPAAPIKLLRHTPNEAPPEQAWRAGWLHQYEQMHSVSFRAPTYFVSFIPFADAVRFLWVKRVVAPLPRNQIRTDDYPFPAHFDLKGVAYELERLRAFDAFEGRAIFAWSNAKRPYHTWHKPDKPLQLHELLAPDALSSFNGYGQVFLSIHDIGAITRNESGHRDWTAALSAVSGVYLITDMRNGDLYVGSATGADGFLGRFSDYASTRHGNNARLRKRLTEQPHALEDWRWSILETLPIGAPRQTVLAQESFQKVRLGSRAYGLNPN